MTGSQRLSGPASTGLFASIGRGFVLAAVTAASLLVLFVSATFVLVAVGVILVLALLAVAAFWVRAKLTGRPFGPRAVMEARMAELRAQMEAAGGASPFGPAPTQQPDGMTIDLQETPQGWTVER